MIGIIFKVLIPMGLAFAGLLQTVLYFNLRKTFSRWPLAGAEISHSRLLNQLGADNENMIEAIIYFKYRFRGKEYENNTPALRGYNLFPSLEYERTLVNKYRLGDIVNVRVHPEHPEFAYLEVAPLSKASTILAPLMPIAGVTVLAMEYYGLWDMVFEYISILYEHLSMQLDNAIINRNVSWAI